MKKITLLTLVIAILCSTVSVYAEGWTCTNCGNAATENYCCNCGAAQSSGETISSQAFVDYSLFTDEELEQALIAIKAEQRARLKTKIVLSSTELTIVKGRSEKITAEVVDVPEDTTSSKLAWETSDKTVATCVNGNVKAVGAGTATITCMTTLSDGTEITAECTVTVIVLVNGLSASKTRVDLQGGESIQLEIKVNPENASNKALRFESSDPSVVSVDDNGVITGEGNGTAVITITAADESGKTATVRVNVKDNRIDEETAKKAVYTAITNGRSLDVFSSDGMSYDVKKFHPYSYYPRVFKTVRAGTWSTTDQRAWSVQGLRVELVDYGTYFEYNLSVYFDGTNYILSGEYYGANSLDKLYGEFAAHEIENPEWSACKYLIVSPKLLEE